MGLRVIERQEVTEDLFFHLSQAELIELEMSEKDGLSVVLQKIIDTEDGRAIIAEFKKIILGAYGKKSEDGKRFIKNQQLRDEFESSEAYSTLFMELVTDAGAAASFVNGIVPAGTVEAATKALERANLQAVPDTPEKPELRVVSRKAVALMTPDELAELGRQISAGDVKIDDEVT
jgi:hypothetical protein